MTLAVIVVAVLLVTAFAVAAGLFDRQRRTTRRVVVDEPAREVVVERPERTVVTERRVVSERDPRL